MRQTMDITIKKSDEAVGYLQRLKYQISRATFYRHLKQGKLSPSPWTPEVLENYAKPYLSPSVSIPVKPVKDAPPLDVVDLQSERLTADIRGKLAMAELRELQVKIETGQYIANEKHERLLSLEIYIFRDCLRNFCRVVPPELVAKFDLDHEITAEMGDLLIELAERELSQYHGKKFELIVHEDDNAEITEKS